MKKKSFTVFLVILGIFWTTILQVQANDSKFGYYEYDFSTRKECYREIEIPEIIGSTTMEGSLGTLGLNDIPPISTYDIIGSDDRNPVLDTTNLPVRWIGLLYCEWPDGKTTVGTAWLYGPNVIATAGHCIYRRDISSYPTKVTFYPGCTNNIPYYGSYTASKMKVTKQWKNDGNTKYDTGILKLNGNAGKTLGYFSIHYDEDVSAYINKSVWLTGYPAEKENILYRMKGKILDSTAFNLYYQIDVTPGQSGSPIFYSDPNNPNKRICIGLHTMGTNDSVNGYNMGVRICKVMFSWMNTTRDEWN